MDAGSRQKKGCGSIHSPFEKTKKKTVGGLLTVYDLKIISYSNQVPSASPVM